MIPTKYAIKCSTEDQARELKWKWFEYFSIERWIEEIYKEALYTVITYEEAKEKWLLGAISKKEITEQQSEEIATISLNKDEACICLRWLSRMENETGGLEWEDKELYDKLNKFTEL